MAKGPGIPGFKVLKFNAGSAFTGIRDFSGGVTASVEVIPVSNATHENINTAVDVYAGEKQNGTFSLSFLYSAALLTGLNAQLGKEQVITLDLADGKKITMDGFISSIGQAYPLRGEILIDIEVAYGGNVVIT